MNTPKASARLLWPAAVAALVVLADRWTKLVIQRSLLPYDAWPVIPGWLRIVHTENAGAAFGFLAEGGAWWRGLILVGISGLVMVFVAWALWSRSGASATLLTRFGLALILGGAAGNLFDRITRGTVTDFIEVFHRAWSFPAFNVADSAITVGTSLLVLDMLRGQTAPFLDARQK